MAGVMDIAMLLIILGGAYWALKSGVLNSIAATPAPVTIAPAAGETPATGTVPAADGTTPPATTPAPATGTGNPLLDALNDLLGIGGSVGGSNTLPTTGGEPVPTIPIGGAGQPIYQGNPAECSSRYNGSCSTECKSGNSSLCNACNIACGGAAVGAVNVLPSQGGTNPSLCSSKYNGKCNTECANPSSSECQGCKQACGSFPAYAYYVKTPMSLMTSAVFGDEHHSYYSNWGNVSVTNAR
jgi:hypothetical protein